jgi:hypothetical protein
VSGPPSVFLSYSWDSESHKGWVRELGERLTLNGVHVKLDQWNLVPGDSLTQFMEAEIEACDFVLVICTPEYAKKSTARKGGVGYEQQIISGNLASGIERRKFIPVVRSGEMKVGPELAIPPHFQGILAIDMRGPDGIDSHLESLLRAIFKVPAVTAPTLGPPPAFVQDAAKGSASAKPNKPARLSLIDFDGWQLISGVAMNERHPNTFSIPTTEQRAKVIPSDFVKLGFEVAEEDLESDAGVSTFNERMWVQVKGAYGPYLWGTLSNTPSFDRADIGLEFGAEIVFLPEHILDIVDAEQQARDEAEFVARFEHSKKDE